ncbi:MAG: sodium:solute symporter [Planctomycetaceae bacterium]|nr:sodium:solute symporter [Planctomycetaceae bacterium]
MSIHPVDALIVFVYGVMVTWLGIRIGRGSKTSSDYLLGGRSLPWYAVLGSIVATETSTATFLSVPGLTFADGGNFCYLQLAIGYIIGRLLIARFMLPMYFRGELFTAYEVLHKRFGGATRRTASLIFLVTRNLGDGLRLFLTAIVLNKVAGFNLPTCIIIIGIATIAYTFAGGMKAVVWNDCIQLVVYVCGGAIALWLIISRMPGGWSEITSFMTQHDKFQMFDFRMDFSRTYTFAAGLVGGAMLTLGTHGTDQMMVQRYLCTSGQREAGRAVIMSGVIVFLQFSLFLMLGGALACYYSARPDSPAFSSNDEVLATFIVREMPIGLVGVTLAAVFSAAMSTLSSSLNSSAGAVVNDFLATSLTDAQQVRASRGLTIGFGVLQMAIAIVASHYSRSVINDVLAIAGFSAGLLLGLFILGTATKRVGQTCAMAGLLSGTLALLILKFGRSMHLEVPVELAWPWYPVVGAFVTVLAGLIFEQIRRLFLQNKPA